MDYIERAVRRRKVRESELTEPILEITMPSSVDSSIAPPGKHLMSMFVQYAPYRLLPRQTWDDIKETSPTAVSPHWPDMLPMCPAAIEHRQVLSPLDLEQVFGLTGGNIMQGAMNFNQLYSFRPVAGWADHRTPVRGLYLCGAASHPGGGVMGACGKNGATEILRDD